MNAVTDMSSSQHLTHTQPSYAEQPQAGYGSLGHQMPGYSGPVQTRVQEHGLDSDAAEPAAIRSSFAVGVRIMYMFVVLFFITIIH